MNDTFKAFLANNIGDFNPPLLEEIFAIQRVFAQRSGLPWKVSALSRKNANFDTNKILLATDQTKTFTNLKLFLLLRLKSG